MSKVYTEDKKIKKMRKKETTINGQMDKELYSRCSMNKEKVKKDIIKET